MFPVLFALNALLATPSIPSALWGLQGGETREELLAHFAPSGQLDGARWTSAKADSVEVLRFSCAPRNGCFSHPSRAEFYLDAGRLASFGFYFQRETGPTNLSVRSEVTGAMNASGYVRPAAQTAAVGRRTQYYLREKRTILWIQDGADAEIKVYLDQLNPVGRAEALAAGASTTLSHLSGAEEYAQAHKSLMTGRLEKARIWLDAVLNEPKNTALLKGQARYVLAMVLAAEVKKTIDGQTHVSSSAATQALKAIDRAIQLAPSLSTHLEGLKDQIRGLRNQKPK